MTIRTKRVAATPSPRPDAVNSGLTVEDLKVRVIGNRIVHVVVQGAATDWAYVDGVILEDGARLECWERKGVAWLQLVPKPSPRAGPVVIGEEAR